MSSAIENRKQFLIKWNNKFICDRWWRKKYNVSFNSSLHREKCQLDIWTEYLEDQIFNEVSEESELSLEKDKLLQEGTWLTKRSQNKIEEDQEDDLFNKIDLGSLNGLIKVEE